MGEIKPQISLSPGGALSITPEFFEDEALTELQIAALSFLHNDWGAEVYEDDGLARVDIDIAETLGAPDHVKSSGKEKDLKQFVDALNPLLRYQSNVNRDRVLAVDGLVAILGPSVSVYPSFQRWLNSPESTDPVVGAHVIRSMALPFGSRALRTASSRLEYTDDGVVAGDFSMSVRKSLFLVNRHDHPGVSSEGEAGHAMWGELDLVIPGSHKPGMRVYANQRLGAHYFNEGQPLYQIHNHNVIGSQETISLLLAVASLAYAASNYTENTSLTGSVEWISTEKPEVPSQQPLPAEGAIT